LGLQGGFDRHLDAIESLGATARLVRYVSDLRGCGALILPGGESTSMTRLMLVQDLVDPILEFCRTHPVFGTCAGSILLGHPVDDRRVRCLGLMDIQHERNAYGRQPDSFSVDVSLEFSDADPFHAVFIRAPRIEKIGPGVKTLATYGDQPVLVEEGSCLAASFHPELSSDPRIHQYFLEKVKNFHG